MIRYDDVVPFLSAACQSYEGSPEGAAVDDADGEYIRVSGYVRHVIRLLDTDETVSFSPVFGVVEWILEDGEPAAFDLVHAGLLEDLADSGLYEGHRVRATVFRDKIAEQLLIG